MYSAIRGDTEAESLVAPPDCLRSRIVRSLSLVVAVVTGVWVAVAVPVKADTLDKCPAQISSATLIGTTRSGLSGVYGIAVTFGTSWVETGSTADLGGMHLYIRDDAGNETWIYVPPHTTADPAREGLGDYFSFGWRKSSHFDVSIADVSLGSRQFTCGGLWLPGGIADNGVLQTQNSWDDWVHVEHPSVDLSAFHPAETLDVHNVDGPSPGGPASGDCHIAVTVNSSGKPVAFSIERSSGYHPFDAACIEAAKRSTYRAATFNNAMINSTVTVDWWYATISD